MEIRSPRSIRAGALLECDNRQCRKLSKFPVEISRSALPVRIQCPYCKVVTPIKNTWIGKVAPQVVNSVYLILTDDRNMYVPKDGDGTGTEVPQEIENVEPVSEASPPPFWNLASAVGEHWLATQNGIEKLNEHIAKFGGFITEYFTREVKKADSYRLKWNPAYLPEFLARPFASVTLPCEDEVSAQYSRLIVSPKFFNPQYGFKIHGKGGLRLEVMNQYSRINFPLEIETVKALGVPPDLDLRVSGRKVYGSSLQLCWDQIPGVVKDSDFTEDMASVIIDNTHHARGWLANHGVRPWGRHPIETKELNMLEPLETIRSTQIYMDAWMRLRNCGRIGVFWSNTNELRRFAALAGLMIRGVTAVFVAGQADEAAWRSLYTLHNHQINWGQELCFFRNGESYNWDSILRTKSVILDLTNPLGSMVETRTIERLYEHPGRVIVICRDPLLDFSNDNYYAKLIHGLTGFEHYENPNWEIWDADHGNYSPEMFNVIECLGQMSTYPSEFRPDRSQTPGT